MNFWRNFAHHLFWIFAPNIVHIISWKFILDQKWRFGTVWGDERQACHFKRWIPFILSSSSSGRSYRWLAWWAKVTLFILIVFVRPLVGRRDTSSSTSPGLSTTRSVSSISRDFRWSPEKPGKNPSPKCIQLRKCRLSQFSSSSTQFLNGELLPRLLTLIIEAFFSKHRFLSFSVLFTFPFPFVPQDFFLEKNRQFLLK